jgi:hypothetical protein
MKAVSLISEGVPLGMATLKKALLVLRRPHTV